MSVSNTKYSIVNDVHGIYYFGMILYDTNGKRKYITSCNSPKLLDNIVIMIALALGTISEVKFADDLRYTERIVEFHGLRFVIR